MTTHFLDRPVGGARVTAAVTLILVSVGMASPGDAQSAGAASSAPDPLRGLPQVTLGVADGFIEQVDTYHWFFGSPEIDVPVLLSAPAGGSGASMGYSTGGGSSGTASFAPGELAAAIPLVPPPFGGMEIFPGWNWIVEYLYLTPPAVNAEIGSPFWMTMHFVQESVGREGDDTECFYCFLWSMARAAGYPVWPDCTGPASALGAIAGLRGAGDPVTILRRYRDETLASTVEGQYYIDLYHEHSPDMMRASVAEPSFVARLLNASEDWTTAIGALVDGTGDQALISQAMADDLNAMLDTFESVGSPALAATIAFERSRLELDSVAGMTMDAFQTQIETLGGSTSVDASTWGRIKAGYRAENRR